MGEVENPQKKQKVPLPSVEEEAEIRDEPRKTAPRQPPQPRLASKDRNQQQQKAPARHVKYIPPDIKTLDDMVAQN